MYSPLCNVGVKCEFILGNICINRWNSKSCMGFSQEQLLYLELLLTKNIPSPWLPGELEGGKVVLPMVKVMRPQAVQFS